MIGKSVTVGPLAADEAERLAETMRLVICDLTVYNDRARTYELDTYTASHLRDCVAQDPDFVLIAREGSDIVGFVIAHDDLGTLSLDWVGVVESVRGWGVSQKLLDELAMRARSLGYRKIWCDCRTDNAASRRALNKAGYVEICTLREHWFGQDYLLLETWLATA